MVELLLGCDLGLRGYSYYIAAAVVQLLFVTLFFPGVPYNIRPLQKSCWSPPCDHSWGFGSELHHIYTNILCLEV